jgi:hypothetical protein
MTAAGSWPRGMPVVCVAWLESAHVVTAAPQHGSRRCLLSAVQDSIGR